MKITRVDHAEFVVDDGERQHRVWIAGTHDRTWAFCDGEVWAIDAAPAPARRRRTAAHETLAAPMPATVVRLPVAVGDAVTKGQTVLVLEAMKMELPLRAAHDGAITAINCAQGDLVQPGVILVEIE
jgi:biotin carboxyl carrier protein